MKPGPAGHGPNDSLQLDRLGNTGGTSTYVHTWDRAILGDSHIKPSPPS